MTTQTESTSLVAKTLNQLKSRSGVSSVNGSTGAVTVKDYVTGLSVSGQTVTFTRKDGTSGTITTQDTNTVYTHPSSHPASMITGLSAVATSGNYDDLSNKPSIPSALAAYPVGSIYMSVNSTNPSQLFGGTWVALNEGRVLIGAGTAYPAGSTGGEASHTLTTAEMPSHSHSGSADGAGNHCHSFKVGGKHIETGTIPGISWQKSNGENATPIGRTEQEGSHSHNVSIGNAGGNSAHNNMQPYLSVYMWKRTA